MKKIKLFAVVSTILAMGLVACNGPKSSSKPQLHLHRHQLQAQVLLLQAQVLLLQAHQVVINPHPLQ